MENWESSMVMVPMERFDVPILLTVRKCGVLVELIGTVPKFTLNSDTVISGLEPIPDKKALTGFSPGLFDGVDELPGGKITFVRITNESNPFKKNHPILHLLDQWNMFISIRMNVKIRV